MARYDAKDAVGSHTRRNLRKRREGTALKVFQRSLGKSRPGGNLRNLKPLASETLEKHISEMLAAGTLDPW